MDSWFTFILYVYTINDHYYYVDYSLLSKLHVIRMASHADEPYLHHTFSQVARSFACLSTIRFRTNTKYMEATVIAITNYNTLRFTQLYTLQA